jgi:hypothetical protein
LPPRHALTAYFPQPSFRLAGKRVGERSNAAPKDSEGESTRHASTPIQFLNPLSGLPERGSASEAMPVRGTPLEGESTRHASTPIQFLNPLSGLPERGSASEAMPVRGTPLEGESTRHASTRVHFFHPLSGLPEREGRQAKQCRSEGLLWRVSQPALHPRHAIKVISPDYLLTVENRDIDS